jgi:hypothetical protein
MVFGSGGLSRVAIAEAAILRDQDSEINIQAIVMPIRVAGPVENEDDDLLG